MTDPVALARERIRPTRRAVLVGLLGLLLYAAGSNVSAGWVVLVAAVALGSLPWALWAAVRASRAVRVARTLPGEATAGVAVPVRLDVSAPVASMAVVADELTGTVGVAAGLRHGVTLEGTAPLRRGVVSTGRVTVELADPFGLVAVVCAGEVPAAGVVRPAVPRLRARPLDIAWAVEAGQDATRGGHGTEILGVREYRPGDPVRGVHWRSTARRGQLVVRETAEPARARVDVVVGAGTWTVGALDRALEVATAVADDAASRGQPTTLAADGERVGWHDGLRRWLATLPPHAGAPARPLAPVPPSGAEVVVELLPSADGARLVVAAGGSRRDLGVVPADAGLEALASWLALALERVTGVPA